MTVKRRARILRLSISIHSASNLWRIVDRQGGVRFVSLTDQLKDIQQNVFSHLLHRRLACLRNQE